MYPVSEAFLTAVQENTRRYYWTGRITTKTGEVHEFSEKDIVKWIGQSDIKIAIENTSGFREYEKKAIEYLLEKDCFVLTWDIGHSKATKEEDVPFILQHKNKLRHFHIHDGKRDENEVLNTFLYEAIFIPEGFPVPSKDIINQPELQVYVKDFNHR